MNIVLERDSYMKGSGMLVGDFEITLKRKKIWVGLQLFLTPKR